MITKLRVWLLVLRPSGWIKNFLVFAGLLFSGKLLDPYFFTRALGGFACFCAAASSIYIINDIIDRKADALHPKKRLRPIAAGQVSILHASVLSGLLLIFSLIIAFYIDSVFLKIIIFYFFLTTAYSGFLKKIVILDIICISIGFVLRAAGGAAAVEAQISPWLISCTFLIALFMAAGKRRSEIVFVKPLEDSQTLTRSVLSDYDEAFLDNILSVLSSLSVMSYLLYTFSARTQAVLGSDNLKYTVPIVVYGVFRYLLLLKTRGIEQPEKLIFQDKGILFSIILWILTVIYIIY
jgi:4-hydroxybenzoate polyprenyltransferase